jgi:hypothetical protein
VRVATLKSGPLWLHLTLLENPKKPRARASLAPPLRVDARGFGAAAAAVERESYEELDEVTARFVEPLVARYREVRRRPSAPGAATPGLEGPSPPPLRPAHRDSSQRPARRLDRPPRAPPPHPPARPPSSPAPAVPRS